MTAAAPAPSAAPAPASAAAPHRPGPRDWPALAALAARLLAVDLALRVWGFERVRRRLERSAPAGAGGTAATETADPAARLAAADRLARLAEVAARRNLYPIRCLARALTVRHLLARRGVVARLRLGVRRSAGSLDAHAWVELEGRPLGEPPEVTGRFAALS